MKIAEPLWQQFLALKQQLKASSDYVAIAIGEAGFELLSANSDWSQFASQGCSSQESHSQKSQSQKKSWDALLFKKPLQQVEVLSKYDEAISLFNERAWFCCKPHVSEELKQIYRHYLPLAASRFIFQHESFLIAHAAQSLDGKMCTINGASQWIGNDANLVHAHRIRALVDGIVVGANTMRNEHPKLSVRHVSGESPKRIVLCNSFQGFEFRDLSDTLVICGEGTPASKQCPPTTHYGDSGKAGAIPFACNGEGKVDVNAVRHSLMEFGIHSVMVEGGPETLSQFIHQRGIDWLQIHIAPILFGSGKSIYESEQIKCVSEALVLDNACYVQMDEAMMLSGEMPAKPANGS